MEPWKGKYNSSGARSILTNSCLSSLPTYMMGFYLLHDGTHRKMDSIRGNFYWQGAEDKFKYHMLKWEAVARPKEYGGLGIINTRIMNECLIVKWIWKIVAGDNSIWCRLLWAKYCKNRDFFSSRSGGSYEFWKGLHKVKHLFQWGATYKVHKGVKVCFWTDVWMGNVPLKLVYPNRYKICENTKAKMADYFSNNSWNVKLRWNMGGDRKRWMGSAYGFT